MKHKIFILGISLILTTLILSVKIFAQTSDPDFLNHPDFKLISNRQQSNLVVYNGKLFKTKPIIKFTRDSTINEMDFFSVNLNLNKIIKDTTKTKNNCDSLIKISSVFNLITEHAIRKKIRDRYFVGEIHLPNAFYQHDKSNLLRINTLRQACLIDSSNTFQSVVDKLTIKSGFLRIKNKYEFTHGQYIIHGQFELENEQFITFCLSDAVQVADKTQIGLQKLMKFLEYTLNIMKKILSFLAVIFFAGTVLIKLVRWVSRIFSKQ